MQINIKAVDMFTIITYTTLSALLFFLILFSSISGIVFGLALYLLFSFLIGYAHANIERCYKVLLICSVLVVPLIFLITINMPAYPYFPIFISARKLGVLGMLNPNHYKHCHSGSLAGYDVLIFQVVLFYTEFVLMIALVASAVGTLFSEIR